METETYTDEEYCEQIAKQRTRYTQFAKLLTDYDSIVQQLDELSPPSTASSRDFVHRLDLEALKSSSEAWLQHLIDQRDLQRYRSQQEEAVSA